MAYRPRVAARGASGGAARIGPTDGGAKAAKAAGGAGGRPVRMQTGIVKHAAGSALLALGGTQVLCSVHGPRAIKRSSDFGAEGTLKCEVRLAPFSEYDLHGLNGREVEVRRMKKEQRLAEALTRSVEASVRLERFPKSLLEVHALVLSDDGGAQAAAVACASLALADSGVELFDLVPCAHVGLVAADGAAPRFVVDPDWEQLKECSGVMTVALLPANDHVSDLCIEGAMTFEEAGLCAKEGFARCVALQKLMTDHLLEKAEEREAMQRNRVEEEEQEEES